jgi:hypothetical protein
MADDDINPRRLEFLKLVKAMGSINDREIERRGLKSEASAMNVFGYTKFTKGTHKLTLKGRLATP